MFTVFEAMQNNEGCIIVYITISIVLFVSIIIYWKKDGENDEADDNNTTKPYFERQSWEFCLIHSLNALFQQNKYTIKDMNKICKTLSPNTFINPHKSILQTGTIHKIFDAKNDV